MSSESATRASESEHYQGHLSDGSSVQKHSVGNLYPCVLFVKHNRYGLITPTNQEGTMYDSYDLAVAAGLLWKALH